MVCNDKVQKEWRLYYTSAIQSDISYRRRSTEARPSHIATAPWTSNQRRKRWVHMYQTLGFVGMRLIYFYFLQQPWNFCRCFILSLNDKQLNRLWNGLISYQKPNEEPMKNQNGKMHKCIKVMHSDKRHVYFNKRHLKIVKISKTAQNKGWQTLYVVL